LGVNLKVLIMWKHQPITILNFQHDGQSNVLELSVHDTIDEETVKQCVAGYIKFARNIKKIRDCFGTNISNCVAKSTDFACSHPDCTYHHKLESRFILHARSHLTFEVSPDAKSGTVMRFDRNCLKYTCSKCPRVTTDKACFREHLRHHLFQRPYSCSICSLPLSSITQVRIHFQKEHPKQQTDLVFNEADCSGVLDNVVELFNSDAKPIGRAFKLAIVDRSSLAKLSQVITKDLPTKISSNCNASSMQLSNDGIVFKPSVEICENGNSTGGFGELLLQSKSASSNKLPTPGATCSFTNGIYSCNNCSYKTAQKESFATHVWKHIHNAWGSNCKHNSENGGTDCLVLNGLTEILSNIANKKVCEEQFQSSIKSKVSSAHMG